VADKLPLLKHRLGAKPGRGATRLRTPSWPRSPLVVGSVDLPATIDAAQADVTVNSLTEAVAF
jgi:hypothetical protein